MTQMNKIHQSIILFIAFSMVTLLSTNAHADKCLGTLISDYSSLDLESSATFALMDIVQNDLTKNQSNSIDATIPIFDFPTKLNAESARTLSSIFKRQIRTNWDHKTKISLIQKKLPLSSVEAYKVCVEGQRNSGPKITRKEVTDNQVNLKVIWISAPGAPTSSNARYTILGGSPVSGLPHKWSTSQEETFAFIRNPGEDFTFIMNIQGETDSDFVAFEPKIKMELEQGVISFPTVGSEPFRMANDGTGRNQGPLEGCLFAPDNAIFDSHRAYIDISVKAGALDHTTYAEVIEKTASKVCWRSFLRPLAKEGGGDFRFRVNVPFAHYKFSIDGPKPAAPSVQ